jgi:predicted dinucleotide-binding enzyme
MKKYMKIGILGTGIVGRSHAEKLLRLGHDIMIGTRDVDKTLAQSVTDQMGNETLTNWLKKNPQIKLGTFLEASEFAELIINVLRGEIVLAVFSTLNADKLVDKVIIDIANDLDFSKGMPPVLLTRDGNSLGERLQELLPKSKIVKSLNTVSAQLQVNPRLLADGDHVVFVSGNDDEAKKVVEQILKSYGWKDIIDLGDITTARGAELMMPIWLRLWGVVGTTMFNYKIVK